MRMLLVNAALQSAVSDSFAGLFPFARRQVGRLRLSPGTIRGIDDHVTRSDASSGYPAVGSRGTSRTLILLLDREESYGHELVLGCAFVAFVIGSRLWRPLAHRTPLRVQT